MLIKLLTKVFGSRNDRTLRRMRKVVNIINAMEPEMEKLSDEELKGKTAEFRARLEKGEVLENLIPEAFAVVREASKRVFGMRHFDVQLLGGMVLNERCIAEMRTGEGKTLTATLPAYLNALTGKGVHVVTVNDYLAQRDAENNRPLFEFLGLTVGINLPGMPAPAKREAYAADITYGTNKETPSNSQTRKPNINVRTVRNVTTTGTTVMTSIKSVYGIFATVRINAFFNVFLIRFSYLACNANP